MREVRARVARILAFRGLGMQEQDRDDLEQEIMTQIWQAVNRPDFDVAGGFWGFVELVASRRSIDWLRRRRDEPSERLKLQRSRNGPLQEALEQERLQLGRRALARLDPACRQLIYLHLEAVRSYREMAELLGRSEGALRVQMYRCVRRARRILNDLTNPDRQREQEDTCTG